MDPMYIHQRPDWPEFRWDGAALAHRWRNPLRPRPASRRMESPLFPLPRLEANLEVLTVEIVKSSAIEGEKLDADQVRSSLARRLELRPAEPRRLPAAWKASSKWRWTPCGISPLR
jgi:Fic family protein